MLIVWLVMLWRILFQWLTWKGFLSPTLRLLWLELNNIHTPTLVPLFILKPRYSSNNMNMRRVTWARARGQAFHIGHAQVYHLSNRICLSYVSSKIIGWVMYRPAPHWTDWILVLYYNWYSGFCEHWSGRKLPRLCFICQGLCWEVLCLVYYVLKLGELSLV